MRIRPTRMEAGLSMDFLWAFLLSFFSFFFSPQPLMSSFSLSPWPPIIPLLHASSHLREMESETMPKLIICVGERRNLSASCDTMALGSTLAPWAGSVPPDRETAISRPVSRPLASSPSGPIISESGLAKMLAATPVITRAMPICDIALAALPDRNVKTAMNASTARAVGARPYFSTAAFTPLPIVWNGTVNSFNHSKSSTNFMSQSAVVVMHRYVS
ncbi:Uncharacterised protein [Mycobacteroides abscessus subsp. abscessus]|nr:Uncharacterised protein [Mycobacteroides abscessus subsp. abscessus]